MIPKRIELENFLSFGKPAVEFTFTDDEPLWALCGRNGVGKSAVFDGITYALYGEHRGGKINAEQLIRHGANGFRIVFDFEFAGIDYRLRITRCAIRADDAESGVPCRWRVECGGWRQLRAGRREMGEANARSGISGVHHVGAAPAGPGGQALLRQPRRAPQRAQGNHRLRAIRRRFAKDPLGKPTPW